MIITFTSTLTSDDEDRVARALLPAITNLVDLFPVAYRIRVDTVAGHSYQATSKPPQVPPARSAIKLIPKDSGG